MKAILEPEDLIIPQTDVYNSASSHTRGLSMAGKIRSRERKCPTCKRPFEIKEEEDIYCPICNTRPKTFYIFLYWHGKHRISRDLDGYILDTYKRAHRLIESIRKDIDDGIFNLSNYLPKEIEQFKGYKMLPLWKQSKVNQGLSGWHLRKVSEYIRNYYEPYFKDIDTRRIAKYHIENFISGFPVNLSLKTKKNIMDMLKNFCRWLYQREILSRVPVFPVITPSEPSIRFITKEVQLKCLERIPEAHRPIFTFLMYHPVRLGEACALQVKHFNVKSAVVEICQAVGYKNEIKSRKNKKPYYLPISKHFDLSILKDKLPEAYVFTHKGKLYSSKYLGEIWRRAISNTTLPYINLYNATRHSIASQAVNSGIGLDRISKALGHSTLEMTKKYASMNVELLRDVVDGTQADGSQVVHISKKAKDKRLK